MNFGSGGTDQLKDEKGGFERSEGSKSSLYNKASRTGYVGFAGSGCYHACLYIQQGNPISVFFNLSALAHAGNYQC